MTELTHEAGLSNALIMCDDGVDHAILSCLLENNGFPIVVSDSLVTGSNLSNFGAIIHIGYSEKLLEDRLGSRLNDIRDEEWIFMAGGDANDLYCTVEVTPKASERLRHFIRLLWSQFSIT